MLNRKTKTELLYIGKIGSRSRFVVVNRRSSVVGIRVLLVRLLFVFIFIFFPIEETKTIVEQILFN